MNTVEMLGTQRRARQSPSPGSTQGLDREKVPLPCGLILPRQHYGTAPVLCPVMMPTDDHPLIHSHPSKTQIMLAFVLSSLNEFRFLSPSKLILMVQITGCLGLSFEKIIYVLQALEAHLHTGDNTGTCFVGPL